MIKILHFLTYLENDIMRLQNYQLENYEKTDMDLFNKLNINALKRKITKKTKAITKFERIWKCVGSH